MNIFYNYENVRDYIERMSKKYPNLNCSISMVDSHNQVSDLQCALENANIEIWENGFKNFGCLDEAEECYFEAAWRELFL